METIELSEADFESTISQGVFVIDFWATWCGPCKMQGAILDKMAVPPALEGKFKVAKVNIEKEPNLAAKFRVQSIPTLLMVKDGEVKDTMIGIQRAEVLIEKIQTLLAE